MKKEKKMLDNPIQEFLDTVSGKATKFAELFTGNDKFIDQMSETDEGDIVNISTLTENDKYLLRAGIGDEETQLFSTYTNKYLRLRVSKDRKSRKEYVEVHQANNLNEQKQIPMGTGGRMR